LQHKQESFVIQYQESLKISSKFPVLSWQSLIGCPIPMSVIGRLFSFDFVMLYSLTVLLNHFGGPGRAVDLVCECISVSGCVFGQ